MRHFRPLLALAIAILSVWFFGINEPQKSLSTKVTSQQVVSRLQSVEIASTQAAQDAQVLPLEQGSKNASHALFSLSQGWKLKKQDNIIRTAFGGVVLGRAQNLAEVSAFLEDFLSFAGVQSQENEMSNKTDLHGNLEEIVYFDQKHLGKEVYNSYAKVFVRKQDRGITYVINEFQNITFTDGEVRFSQDQLHELIRQKYNATYKASHCPREVYFVLQGQALLSAVCYLTEQDSPEDHREIVLSLKDGQILRDISKVIYN
jgi:hypothetical protein